MSMEAWRIVADVATLPVLGLVGYLVRRAVAGLDKKLDEIAATLKETSQKMAAHDSLLAVHEYRLNKLDNDK